MLVSLSSLRGNVRYIMMTFAWICFLFLVKMSVISLNFSDYFQKLSFKSPFNFRQRHTLTCICPYIFAHKDRASFCTKVCEVPLREYSVHLDVHLSVEMQWPCFIITKYICFCIFSPSLFKRLYWLCQCFSYAIYHGFDFYM